MIAEAAGLGVVIGLFLGALGGGGGVLVVPALVFLLGRSAQDATTSSIIIVGLTAVAGTLTRLRDGLVDWRTGLSFGLVGVPAAYLGTLANHRVAQPVLLLSFAGLTVLAALAMLGDARPGRSEDGGPDGEPGGDDPGNGEPGGTGSAAGSGPAAGSATAATAGTTATGTTTTRTMTVLVTGSRSGLAVLVAKVVLCGLVIGFLTGFLGVGGGFLVVPALVIALRMPMPLAIGTSLLIIAVNSVSSLASRIGVAVFDWRLIVPFTAAAVLASLAGKRFADRLTGQALSRSFAVVLLLVGVLVGAHGLGAV
ncbi:MAG TPA: sulfite exporter TauE/SafE family protein [Pseudonocardia sp.]|jgi:hypothetical protein